MKNRALGLAVFLIFSGCATTPITRRESPQALWDAACSVGAQVRSVKGTAILRARSRTESGTFPATIVGKPDSLVIEANNLLGGVEAVITIQQGRYDVRVPDHPERGQGGGGSWGGIPLYWANELFLGRVPCPPAALRNRVALDFIDEETLRARLRYSDSSEELYLFRFSDVGGKAWPKTLRWERRQPGHPAIVEFQFEDPEEGTRSPLRWEAHSANGDVKVRWKEREVSR